MGGLVFSVKLRNTLLEEILSLYYKDWVGFTCLRAQSQCLPKLEFKFGYICLTDTCRVKSNNLFLVCFLI